MSILEGFEDDVFISYASVDDALIADAGAGWVSQLHLDLKQRVHQVLGQEPKFWRDDSDLRGNDQLTPTLIRVLENSGALLLIVSPGFISSKWCRKEVEAFCAKHGGKINLPGNTQFRIFKVIKIPVKRDKQFPEIQEALPYEFYELATQGFAVEFAPWADKPRSEKYTFALYRLARDIANYLEAVCSKAPASSTRATVYLAETTYDLRQTRNELWDDLRGRGFEVLPDRELNRDGSDYRDQVRGYLQRSDLSVHLIGEKYGAIPEGETASHVAVQADLAAARCSDPGFRRVIWMPPGLQPAEDAQRKFIAYLENDTAAQPRTELVQKNLEDLKTDLQAWLAEKAVPQPSPAEALYPRVFVIADPQDLESGGLAPLVDFINEQGFEVRVSSPAKDEAEMLKAYQENLRTCRGCIIYYGQGSGAWVDIKLADLENVFGQKPDPPRAVYVAEPQTALKKMFRPRGLQVVREAQQFSPETLAPFLQAVRAHLKPA